jgi:hypothetical protein
LKRLRLSSAVVWRGASLIDRSPIAAVVTGLGKPSQNVKTGAMAQLWIIRADAHPVEAARTGADRAICGDCPARALLGGWCYVELGKAPAAVYRKLAAGGYPEADPVEVARLSPYPIRLGAYGDPVAVPVGVLRDLCSSPNGWTGYTHQWRTRRAQRYRPFLMASCDTEADRAEAEALGWRAYTLDDGSPEAEAGSVLCPHYTHGTTCARCGLCSGTSSGARSVRAPAHGARRHRAAVYQGAGL